MDDRIEIGTGATVTIKRLYTRHKLLFAGLVLSVSFLLFHIVFDAILPREVGISAVILMLVMVTVDIVANSLRSTVTSVNTIPRAAIESVNYHEGSVFRSPRILVEYEDGETRKVRPIWFSARWIEGKEQFERARDALDSAGIELEPVSEDT